MMIIKKDVLQNKFIIATNTSKSSGLVKVFEVQGLSIGNKYSVDADTFNNLPSASELEASDIINFLKQRIKDERIF